MRRPPSPLILLPLLFLLSLAPPLRAQPTALLRHLTSRRYDAENVTSLKDRVADALAHGYNGYITHAYPGDLLNPIDCTSFSPHFKDGNVGFTLIDSLSTLYVVDRSMFRGAVHNITKLLKPRNFDVDVTVNLFETTIRLLGGLVSAHMLAENETWYEREQGILLSLAVDLGTRLLPAFRTPTGIPYNSINLRHGVPRGETPLTSTSSAGTLLLEFSALSRLSGDGRFEAVARNAARQLFLRRFRATGLPGSQIDVLTGRWTQTETGIGNNVDSFYECLLKYALIFGEAEEMVMFHALHTSFIVFAKVGSNFGRIDASRTGAQLSFEMESLGAYLPGLHVLYGEVSAALLTFRLFMALWNFFGGGLPERIDFSGGRVLTPSYPLRPELMESAFYLASAIPALDRRALAARFISAIDSKFRTPCGYVGSADLTNNINDQFMDSFFLAETLKYLWLLLDAGASFPVDEFIFTTEAHPLRISRLRRGGRSSRVSTSASETLELLSRTFPHLQTCEALPMQWSFGMAVLLPRNLEGQPLATSSLAEVTDAGAEKDEGSFCPASDAVYFANFNLMLEATRKLFPHHAAVVAQEEEESGTTGAFSKFPTLRRLILERLVPEGWREVLGAKPGSAEEDTLILFTMFAYALLGALFSAFNSATRRDNRQRVIGPAKTRDAPLVQERFFSD